jgi:CRISPR-associated protein Cas5h
MDTLVFEARGGYALFRKPYSPMSPVSYPFPPPTAVLGMLGAVAGYGKEEYAECLGWRGTRVAVRLLAPVRVLHAALNLLNTKDGTDPLYFRPRADANTHIQVPCEFLRDVAYRIYVAGLPEAAHQRLAEQLAAGRSVYTVSLGWAPCLADLAWVGALQAGPVAAADDWSCDTVLPLHGDLRVHYEDERRYHRMKVPADMDAARVVHRYQEVVMAEDGGPVRGSGGGAQLWEVGGETIALL